MAESLHRSALIVERSTENAKTITLRLGASLDCRPGQFAMLWLPGLDEKPFSISSSDPLCFTIARVGPFSEALQGLVAGDRLWYRGPFGTAYPVTPGPTGADPWVPAEAGALLVGGGYGAAPLHFLARRILECRPDARVEAVLGARTRADLLFADRFARIGVPVHAATEDGSVGHKGLATEAARSLLESGDFDGLYACGPQGMLESLASTCAGFGITAHLSYEAYMRCGIGLCGSCEHGGRLVCMDGPVFTLDPAVRDGIPGAGL
jgi:dihydroorotate dehydrogenase electron transfer subunit